MFLPALLILALQGPRPDVDVIRVLPEDAVTVEGLRKVEVETSSLLRPRADLGWSLGGITWNGMVVAEVEPRGPASKAGILPGDLVQAIGRTEIRETADLEAAFGTLEPGRPVRITVFRPAVHKTVTIQRDPESKGWPGFDFRKTGGKFRVERVDPRGAAERAGLKVGDTITKVNRRRPTSSGFLRRLLAKAKKAAIRVDRRASKKLVRVKPRAYSKNRRRLDWRGKTFRLAVVLVEFRDRFHEPLHKKERFAEMLFSKGTYSRAPDGRRTYGSLRDYYRENSVGRFDVTGEVFDWVRVPENWAYYDEQDMGPGNGSKRTIFKDALKALEKREGKNPLEGFQGVVFIYAGDRQSYRGSQLWPHRSSIRIGKRSVPYYIVEAGSREFASIGVHCHEFGHMLGLPDFYGYGHRTGVGKFCTMAIGHLGAPPSGKDRPFHLCAFCKEQLGWLEPVVVRPRDMQHVILRPIEGSGVDALKILLDPGGAEYFLLEVRNRSGFDADFFRDGLLIWHVGERGQAARGQIGVDIDLEEAHGRRYFDASLREEDQCIFPSRNTRDFTPYTFPSSESSRTGAFKVAITEIRVYRPREGTGGGGVPPGSVVFWIGALDRAAPGIPNEPPPPGYRVGETILEEDPVTGLPVPFRIGADGFAERGPNIMPRPDRKTPGTKGGKAPGNAGGRKKRRFVRAGSGRGDQSRAIRIGRETQSNRSGRRAAK